MSKRLFIGLLSGALALTLALPGAAVAKDKDKGDCKKGAWREVATSGGQAFASQGECVDYVSNGGTLAPARAFAIAYTDLDGVVGYDEAQDILIAKLIDASGDGQPGRGDLVVMGRYPLTFDPAGASDFGDWQVPRHEVTDATADTFLGTYVTVAVSGGGRIRFGTEEGNAIVTSGGYYEWASSGERTNVILDNNLWQPGRDKIDVGYPELSRPSIPVDKSRSDYAPDDFIEITIAVD